MKHAQVDRTADAAAVTVAVRETIQTAVAAEMTAVQYRRCSVERSIRRDPAEHDPDFRQTASQQVARVSAAAETMNPTTTMTTTT